LLWKGRRQSQNVEDRRGVSGRTIAAGGGVGALIVTLLILLLGGKPDEVMQNLQVPQASSQEQTQPLSAEDKEEGEFVAVVLADTEDVWRELFSQEGQEYREPSLVMFSDVTDSACGYAQAASGPFYCPGDEKVYIDLGFFREMQQQLGAEGDFARAYVIAHEIGHHVQNLLGIMGEVQGRQQGLSQREANRSMVRLELQADFLAGVWAHHAQRMKNILETGDIEEGINAAAAVGDDRIMKSTRGYVVPDAFTHGTSQQRVYWFKLGFQTGDINKGNTFEADEQ
jgi:predicted metalloprotease